MDKPPITNKAQYYALWNEGKLGNRPKFWGSLEELQADSWDGLISVRARTTAGVCSYGVQKSRVMETIQGREYSNLTFNEAMPDERITIQGEILQSERHLELFYSFEPGRMRDALRNSGQRAHGLEATLLLKRYLDPNSYEEVQELLRAYPGHAIEFSSYSMHVGRLPRRNTIIWEVREY